MRWHHHIGLEHRDGFDVGRDPRTMTTVELDQLGHARVSPLRALRLKCLDCCDGSASRIRLCPSVDCPSWPFRMGRNPWLSPLSAEARAQRVDLMRRNRVSALTTPDKTQVQTDASAFDGVRVPNATPAGFPSIEMDDEPGGVQ